MLPRAHWPLTFTAKLANLKTYLMEPVTHFLTGATLARTGFNRKTALATVTMMLAAEAADMDIVAYGEGLGLRSSSSTAASPIRLWRFR